MENLEILVHSLGPSYDLKKRVFLKKHVSSSYDHENEVICVPQECKLNHVFSCFSKKRILFSSYDTAGKLCFFFELLLFILPRGRQRDDGTVQQRNTKYKFNTVLHLPRDRQWCCHRRRVTIHCITVLIVIK